MILLTGETLDGLPNLSDPQLAVQNMPVGPRFCSFSGRLANGKSERGYSRDYLVNQGMCGTGCCSTNWEMPPSRVCTVPAEMDMMTSPAARIQFQRDSCLCLRWLEQRSPCRSHSIPGLRVPFTGFLWPFPSRSRPGLAVCVCPVPLCGRVSRPSCSRGAILWSPRVFATFRQ